MKMDNTENATQFDSSVGGTQNLPKKINILQFVSARSKEILAMTQCIENPQNTKLIFQRLPVHMRRRVMSHNSKRLPRRLRQAHQNQLDKSRASAPAASTSRKYRRRPARLANSFNRRKLKVRWLETHLWHAKRFHMILKWGHSLPHRPCDKSFRACYRASTTHCLLQDISYLRTFVITGPFKKLTAGFQRITNPSCGLTFTAKAFVDSPREGNAYIFQTGQYPFGCLGKVSFIWKPKNDESNRSVWLFVHPGDADLIFQVLNEVFHETSDEIEKVQVMKLENTINRFRLTGPLSHPVLVAALKPLSLHIDQKFCDGIKENWFQHYIKDDLKPGFHENQSAYWNDLKNVQFASELPPHLILGLNVEDPRMNMPFKRTKVIPENIADTNNLINLVPNLNESAIWDSEMLKIISENKLTTHQLNKIIEKSIVPGCGVDESIPGVPIILIQRPGNRESDNRYGYGSGWDVIVPCGFAMAFWMAFILRGARVGGLRETDKIEFEKGQPHYEPDVPSSHLEEQTSELQLKEKYFRTPPNKRVNFAKLSVNNPFRFNWMDLTNEWNGQSNNKFYVLRDKSILKELKNIMKTRKGIEQIDWTTNCLVPVKLSTLKKGNISDRCIICLPNPIDLSANQSSQLVEVKKRDKNQFNRKQLRHEHKKILKRLRRQHLRRKKSIEEKGLFKYPKQDNSVLINEYKEKMRSLWLPNEKNIKNQCSREVMGFVTSGSFCFTDAKSVGVGYVALTSLKAILENSHNSKSLVLTRNITSRQYRLAKLTII